MLLNVTTIVQAISCVKCERCIAFSLMPDSESPATLYEMLYCFFPPDQPIRIAYDNGCNFLHYCLNRDCSWAAQVRILIDWMHAKGHKGCSPSLSTRAQPPSRSSSELALRICAAIMVSKRGVTVLARLLGTCLHEYKNSGCLQKNTKRQAMHYAATLHFQSN